MAQKMGAGLGKRSLLFGSLPGPARRGSGEAREKRLILGSMLALIPRPLLPCLREGRIRYKGPFEAGAARRFPSFGAAESNVMWTAKETMRALRGERAVIVAQWLTNAQTRLWHLDKQLFTRKGAAAHCASETLGCLLAYFEKLEPTAEAAPETAAPLPDPHANLPADPPAQDDAPVGTIPPPAPAPGVFAQFAALQNCGEYWCDLPVCAADLRALLELLAAEVREALLRRGADEPTLTYHLGLFCLVIADAAMRRDARAEQELAVYREEMLVAQHLASRFLGNASHELRTPLTAVLGFAELLQEDTYGELNSEQQTAVGHIENSARNLLEIVNNLLDLLHIRAGKLTLRYHRIVVGSLLQEIHKILSPLADRKKVSFDLELADNLEPIEADENILRHIVYHLLSSSLRATPAGGAVRLRAEQSGTNLVLTTEDTAVHLPPEAVANMAAPFPRIENSPARGFEGWEVGLPLVRRYVDLHDGNLDIESQPESGTIFRITLPMSQPKGAARVEESPAQ